MENKIAYKFDKRVLSHAAQEERMRLAEVKRTRKADKRFHDAMIAALYFPRRFYFSGGAGQ